MKVKMDKKNFERLLDYCLVNKNKGRMKYFYQISISDVFFNDFLQWLKKYDDVLLSFAFIVTRCHEGHKLIYGFTNFEVSEDLTYSILDFKFENDDILSDKFREWKNKSECMLVSIDILGCLELLDKLEKLYDGTEPLKADERKE